MNIDDPKCDLCGDNGPLAGPVHIRARCHMTAPLQVSIEEGRMIVLRCYLPECSREVARYRLAEVANPAKDPAVQSSVLRAYAKRLATRVSNFDQDEMLGDAFFIENSTITLEIPE